MATPPDASDIKYPALLDDDTSLFGDPANLVEFTLNGAIDGSVTSFVVDDPSNYIGTSMEVPGFLRFSTGEIVYFEAMDAGSDTFSSVTRGVSGSSAASHVDEEIVRHIPVGEYFIQLKAAIIAIETELGLDPAGTLTDLKARLAVAINDDGTLKNVGVADNNLVSVDDASISTNDIPRFTANGIEGLTYLEFVTALTEELEDIVGAMVGGASETRISVTYDDTDGELDFTVDVTELSDDTTPVLGGDLDANQKDIWNIKQADYYEVTDNSTSGTAKTIDWNSSNVQKVQLTGDCTFTFTAPAGPAHLTLIMTGDATARTLTWPSTVKWVGVLGEPVWSGASGVKNIMSMFYDGTDYIASGAAPSP